MTATDTRRQLARSAQLVVEALTARDVEYVLFGAPGAKIDAVFDFQAVMVCSWRGVGTRRPRRSWPLPSVASPARAACYRLPLDPATTSPTTGLLTANAE
jgi:hypothetical protein